MEPGENGSPPSEDLTEEELATRVAVQAHNLDGEFRSCLLFLLFLMLLVSRSNRVDEVSGARSSVA